MLNDAQKLGIELWVKNNLALGGAYSAAFDRFVGDPNEVGEVEVVLLFTGEAYSVILTEQGGIANVCKSGGINWSSIEDN